jgi:CheY-like chemotaxis protein
LPLFPRILDLRDLVRDTVRDIKATRPNDFRLTSPELPEEPLLVDGDPVRLGQALVNLVDNAHRYAGPDATITVSLRHMDEGWAELAVADDGIGFDPTHASALFEPYMQDALPDSTQGLGLGLVVVRSIVELHGGTATAQSEGPGKGACFYLRLPVATDAAVEAQQPPPAPRRAPRSLETLFIDDNEDLAVTYKTLLSRRGDKVWIAFTGEEGLAMAEATRFQLVLCDLALGEGMDGYALASELRASQYPAKLVAISGFTETEDHERALAAGFDALLAKPLNLKELDRLVDRWSLR